MKPLLEAHCNLGLAIQIIAEEIVLLMAQEAKRLSGVGEYLPGGWGCAELCGKWEITRKQEFLIMFLSLLPQEMQEEH